MYYFNIYRTEGDLLTNHFISWVLFIEKNEAISTGKRSERGNTVYVRTIECENVPMSGELDSFFNTIFPRTFHHGGGSIKYK